jgi:hypothetical protein
VGVTYILYMEAITLTGIINEMYKGTTIPPRFGATMYKVSINRQGVINKLYNAIISRSMKFEIWNFLKPNFI